MFWGLVLKTNKRYSQRVTKAFHVSQATLDVHTLNSEDDVVQVWVNIDDTDHLIANMSRPTSHVAMDLTFTEGESVAFYSKGAGTVHLSGYLMPDEDFGYGMGEEEEEDESEEENVELPEQALSKKQRAELANKQSNKKALKASQDSDEDDDDDEEEHDDDDDSDDIDMEGLQEELEDDDEDDSDDNDEDDDEDEDDDDEEDDEDDIKEPPSKMSKFDKSGTQNGLTNGELKKKENQQKQKQQKHPKEDKQNKDQKQKNQQQQQQQQKPAKKQLSGGIIIEDIRVGKGPEAKENKKVVVYYEGRLKSNNKVFDSTKSGEGFKFKLGRGEVIRGWDVGIVGMKVGSKRRITCPPQVAYGAKGSPPVIPPNATLVFDVELRGVN